MKNLQYLKYSVADLLSLSLVSLREEIKLLQCLPSTTYQRMLIHVPLPFFFLSYTSFSSLSFYISWNLQFHSLNHMRVLTIWTSFLLSENTLHKIFSLSLGMYQVSEEVELTPPLKIDLSFLHLFKELHAYREYFTLTQNSKIERWLI